MKWATWEFSYMKGFGHTCNAQPQALSTGSDWLCQVSMIGAAVGYVVYVGCPLLVL